MGALIKATTSFVTEKVVVQRERKKGSYGVLPYFLSKIAAEVPLSSLYPTMSALIMYKLCGLNDAPGRIGTFTFILVLESMAATALGMSIGDVCCCSNVAARMLPLDCCRSIVVDDVYGKVNIILPFESQILSPRSTPACTYVLRIEIGYNDIYWR
jgi:hypothetical protein